MRATPDDDRLHMLITLADVHHRNVKDTAAHLYNNFGEYLYQSDM